MGLKVFLDIETLPPDIGDSPVRGRLSSYSEEQFRNLALDGAYGRLLCIGLIVERNDQIIHKGLFGRDRATLRFHLDETRTLRSFWHLIKDFDRHRDLIVGFNILDFDLIFLCQRSVVKQVKPSVEVCFARFRSRPIYDVMWEFTRWRHRITLDSLASALGLRSSKEGELNGSTVYDYFQNGRHQEIADYCLRDVELTRQIYYRLQFIECARVDGGGF